MSDVTGNALNAAPADVTGSAPNAAPADVATGAQAAVAPSAATAASHPSAPTNAQSASPLAAQASAPASTTATTTAPDPLAELRGIHMPQPVGFWPPAPGWWGLAALLVASAVATSIVVRRRRRSVVRHALRELDGLARTSPDADLQTLATRLSALVRRVALLRFGRTRVASLHGRAWQDFLKETAPKNRRQRARFVDDAGLVLSLAPYAPAGAPCVTRDGVAIDRTVLIAATRAWLEENA